MHAVVVNVTIQDRASAEKGLREEVIPRVSQAPGFRGGYWIAVAEDKGMSVVAFDSEEEAKAVAAQLGPPESGGVTIDKVETHPVVASA